MNVEFIEFFPDEINHERRILKGTLRIRIPELNLHILGVIICRNKNYWVVRLPGKFAIHHKTGEQIWFPYVVFEDRERQKQLIDVIREQAPAFIEKRLHDISNPQTIQAKVQNPQRKQVQQAKPQPKEQKNGSEPPIAKKPERPRSYPTIKPNVQWSNPPKRQQTKQQNTKPIRKGKS